MRHTGDEVEVADYAKQPLGNHIEAYLEYLANKTTRGRKTSPIHVANVGRQLHRLAKDLRLVWIKGLSKQMVASWINKQSDLGRTSGRTINTDRAAIMPFCQWVAAHDSDPAGTVQRLAPNNHADHAP